jgi:hypothetical protein
MVSVQRVGRPSPLDTSDASSQRTEEDNMYLFRSEDVRVSPKSAATSFFISIIVQDGCAAKL